MSIFRHSGPYFFSAVAGLATGAGLCVLYFRLSQELAEIRALVVELKQEIAVNNRSRRNYRSKTPGYYSVTASSGDEDDDFEDALAGLSDAEINERHNGLERNVQFASPVSVEFDADDSTSQFFRAIDDFIAAGSKDDYEHAFALLKQKERKMVLRAEFQWRLSKVTYFLANAAGDEGDTERKKENMYEAKDAAQAAINLDSNCFEGHKWFAITLGCTGDYETTSEKIKNAMIIKKHIQIAINLNPQDPTPHHMLGRWCYSVYMLSWLERKAAAALFGTPPTSTVEEAFDHFVKADNLKPGVWKENLLYIGKCLIEMRRYGDAVQWLRKAQSGPEDDDTDVSVQTEVQNLLSKYDR